MWSNLLFLCEEANNKSQKFDGIFSLMKENKK